ncbi:isochorismatase family protein (plasmid) [Escherichia coli]|uniref:isochorismatase family protein n=1 Tax=Escherichia coli TaxID=562 RepID=UPI003BAA2722
MLFPNFSLGEEYEHAPPATNRQISPYLPSGRFRTGLPVEGLAIERGDLFYACPRASVFYGTALDADLRTRGVSTLVMAGISTTGVVLSSVAGLVMRTTTCVWSGLLLRPGSGCPRSSVAFRVRRTCTGRVIFGPRMIAAIAAGGLVRGRGQSSRGAVIAAPATLKTHRRSGGLVIACHYARPIYCSQR